MTPLPAAVVAALAAVDEAPYLPADGVPAPPDLPALDRVLAELAVEQGERVLELGAGTGYAGAVLAELAGADGQVVSVHPDAAAGQRIAALHQRFERRVTLRTADLVTGAPGESQYDRVLCWSPQPVLPRGWIEQTRTGGVILSVVEVAPLARAAQALLRVRVDHWRQPEAEAVGPVEPAEPAGRPAVPFRLPRPGTGARAIPADRHSGGLVDAQAREGGRHWWLSAPWLRYAAPACRDRLLGLARASGLQPGRPSPLTGEESLADFSAWLFATLPGGVTTAGLGDDRSWIGVSMPGGLAVLGSGVLRVAGSPEPATILRNWISNWRDAARPGWRELEPCLVPVVDGWRVRLRQPQSSWTSASCRSRPLRLH